MLGSYAVGKTSLVSRYVDRNYSNNYATTIGVKFDKKSVTVSGEEISLVLWDVYGEDSHKSVSPAYLRGMAGYLLVVDLTRPSTCRSALNLNKLVRKTVGRKPFILVKNKSDLVNDWVCDSDDLKILEASAIAVMETSAKSDSGVDAVFESIAGVLVNVSEHA